MGLIRKVGRRAVRKATPRPVRKALRPVKAVRHPVRTATNAVPGARTVKKAAYFVTSPVDASRNEIENAVLRAGRRRSASRPRPRTCARPTSPSTPRRAGPLVLLLTVFAGLGALLVGVVWIVSRLGSITDHSWVRISLLLGVPLVLVSLARSGLENARRSQYLALAGIAGGIAWAFVTPAWGIALAVWIGVWFVLAIAFSGLTLESIKETASGVAAARDAGASLPVATRVELPDENDWARRIAQLDP